MDGIRLVSPTFMLPTAGAAWYGVTGFGGIAALTYGDQQFLMTAVRIPRRRPGFGPSSQLGAKFVGPGHRRHISVHSSPDLEPSPVVRRNACKMLVKSSARISRTVVRRVPKRRKRLQAFLS